MSKAVTLDSTVSVCGDLVSAPLGIESMMMDVDRGKYYWMDGIGTRVWEMLRAPTAVAELCGTLQAEYHVLPERCEADVSAFLEELRRRGLVAVVDQSRRGPSPFKVEQPLR